MENVHMTALPSRAEEVIRFYVDTLGLERLTPADEDRLELRGRVRTGPRVIIRWDSGHVGDPTRRRLALEVEDLGPLAEILAGAGVDIEWQRGLGAYSSRLAVADPTGNRIEVFSSHLF